MVNRQRAKASIGWHWMHHCSDQTLACGSLFGSRHGKALKAGLQGLRRWCNDLAVLALVLLLISHSAWAESTASSHSIVAHCELEGIQPNIRPGDGNKPVEVSVGLRLLDVTAIEDIDQTITVDYLLVQTWVDRRLEGYAGCRFNPDEVWYPKIDILNSGRLFTRLANEVEVLDDGQVRILQRYKGAVVFPYQAPNFPFDSHEIKLAFLSDTHHDSELVIEVDERITGRPDWDYNVPDWNIPKVDAKVVEYFLEIYERNHSAFELTVWVERRSGFYLWKIIMPMVLIVAMSWSVFWIDPAQFGAQVSMSSASMLTLIAFHFAMTNILPPLSYFTDLDRFIAGATALVFLALVESITTSYWEVKGRRNWALRLDRYCRWLFPATFAAYASYVFLYQA